MWKNGNRSVNTNPTKLWMMYSINRVEYVTTLILQITSRYAGVIKKLHFQADDTVPTGKVCSISFFERIY